MPLALQATVAAKTSRTPREWAVDDGGLVVKVTREAETGWKEATAGRQPFVNGFVLRDAKGTKAKKGRRPGKEPAKGKPLARGQKVSRGTGTARLRGEEKAEGPSTVLAIWGASARSQRPD